MQNVNWSGLLVFALSVGVGILGLGLFGPAGFLAGTGLAVFLGFYVRDSKAKTEERISALEDRVTDLEAEVDRLQRSDSTSVGDDR